MRLGQVSMETATVLGDAVKMKHADVIVTKAPQAHALQQPIMDTMHINIQVEVSPSYTVKNVHSTSMLKLSLVVITHITNYIFLSRFESSWLHQKRWR